VVTLELDVLGQRAQTVSMRVARVVNGGFAGRDQTQVRAHIEELAHLGVADPGETPTFYPLVRTAVSQHEELEVVTDSGNWGEAEPVLLFTSEGLLVGVGSDHTDRDLEGFSILKSKQVYPNMLSRRVWRYDEVIDHWDELLLRAWVGEGRAELFQEAPLAALMRPEDLVRRVEDLVEGDLEGTVFFLGTVAAKKTITFADVFECELSDPRSGTVLVCTYRAAPIRWFKGVL
jgi:hypothetical protein